MRHSEYVSITEDLQLFGPPLLQTPEDVVDDLLDHRHDVVLVLDPGHLPVEGDELRHVAVGVGLLGPEGGTDLVHPVESGGHQDLLVQLGGLGEVGGPVEVLDPEQLGPSLGAGGPDLGSVHAGEPVLPDGLLDEVDHDGLELEDGLYLGLAHIHEPVVETGVHLDVDLVDHTHWEGHGGLSDDLGGGGDELQAQGGLVALLDVAGDGDHGLPGELGEFLEELGVDLLLGHGDLEGAVPVAEGQEGDASQVPDVLDPPVDGGGAVGDGDGA